MKAPPDCRLKETSHNLVEEYQNRPKNHFWFAREYKAEIFRNSRKIISHNIFKLNLYHPLPHAGSIMAAYADINSTTSPICFLVQANVLAIEGILPGIRIH